MRKLTTQSRATPSNTSHSENSLRLAPQLENVFRRVCGSRRGARSRRSERIGQDGLVDLQTGRGGLDRFGRVGTGRDGCSRDQVKGVRQRILGLNGISVIQLPLRRGTHLPTELVDEHLQCISPSISWQINCWTEVRSIFGVFKLDNDRWNRFLGLSRHRRLDSLRVGRLLSLWRGQ